MVEANAHAAFPFHSVLWIEHNRGPYPRVSPLLKGIRTRHSCILRLVGDIWGLETETFLRLPVTEG